MIAGERSSERAAEHVSFLLPRMAARHHSLTQSFLFASLCSHRTLANDIRLQRRLGYTGHHRLTPYPRVRNRNTRAQLKLYFSLSTSMFWSHWKPAVRRSSPPHQRGWQALRVLAEPESATRFAQIAICRSNKLYIQSVCPSLCDHISFNTKLADRP